MKTRRVCAIFAFISTVLSVRAAEKETTTPALDVHEWGTFTTLSGSDGVAVGWYLHQLAEVPSFVETSTARSARLAAGLQLAGKTGTAQRLTKVGTGTLILSGAPTGINADLLPRAAPSSITAKSESGTLTLKSAPPAASTESLTRTGTTFSTQINAGQNESGAEKGESVVSQGLLIPADGPTISIIPARIRMETPVVYFYPQKAMSVRVGVHFQEGTLTEYFPPPLSSEVLGETVWQGDLLPPTDPDFARLLPETRGETGENYGAARHVPEAWYFHASPPAAKPGREWEKFIFYRGSGTRVPPLEARATGAHTVQLRPSDSQPLATWAFALQVEGNRARWKAMPSLQQTVSEGMPNGVTVELTEDMPLDKADAELSAAVTEKLVTSGLTASEAAAMVATWHSLWFREPGTRIVGLVPRRWVDLVLPLHIEPAPQTIQRVFVGRWELITPENEQVLAKMLTARDPMISGDDMDHVHALHLGRFLEGAWARALELTKGQKDSEFSAIRRKILKDVFEAEGKPLPKAVSQR